MKLAMNPQDTNPCPNCGSLKFYRAKLCRTCYKKSVATVIKEKSDKRAYACKKVKIDNLIFTDVSQASRILKISPYVIRNRIYNEYFRNYQYYEDGQGVVNKK